MVQRAPRLIRLHNHTGSIEIVFSTKLSVYCGLGSRGIRDLTRVGKVGKLRGLPGCDFLHLSLTSALAVF